MGEANAIAPPPFFQTLNHQIHYFPSYIFKVHQISTLGGKFNIFLARAKIPLKIHQNIISR